MEMRGFQTTEFLRQSTEQRSVEAAFQVVRDFLDRVEAEGGEIGYVSLSGKTADGRTIELNTRNY